MNPNQGREAAYVKSRVKDLSLITNAPDYVGLFACITPKAHADLENEENITYMKDGSPTDIRNEENKVYLPQLVRDVETLITLFGDPRVDPNTYKDLLSVLNIVQNGFACYIAKVKSGKPFKATISVAGLFNSSPCQINDQLFEADYAQIYEDLQNTTLFTAQSSVIGNNKITIKLIPYKPYNINQVSLEVSFTSQATDASEEVNIVTTRVGLTPDTKNSDFIRTLNSYLGGDLVCQLPEYMDDSVYATPYDAYASIESEEGKYFCIVNALLYISGIYKLNDATDYIIADNMELVGLDSDSVKRNWTQFYNTTKKETFECTLDNGGVIEPEKSTLSVSQADYINSINTYNDPKYSGTFISELSSDITQLSIIEKSRFVPRPNPENFVSFDEDISEYIKGKPVGTNTGTNTGNDTGNDTGTNTGTNTGSDTGTNTGSDTGTNTGDTGNTSNVSEDDLKNAFIDLNQYNYRISKDIKDDTFTHITFSRQSKFVGVCKEYVSGNNKSFVLDENAIKDAKRLVDGNNSNITIYVTSRSATTGDPEKYKLTNDDVKPKSPDSEDPSSDVGSEIFNGDTIETKKVYFICKDPSLKGKDFRVDNTTEVTTEDDTKIKYDNGNIEILLDTYDPNNLADDDCVKSGDLTPIFTYVTRGNDASVKTGENIRNYPVFKLNLDKENTPIKDFFTRTSVNASPTYYVVEDANEIIVESKGLKNFIPIVKAVEKNDKGEWTESSVNDELHQREENALVEMKGDERRGLHYMIKQLAAVRKNLTCIFTTPYCPLMDDGSYDPNNIYDLTKACNWVAARGEFADLFEYGNAQAIEYSDQAFYCEMYWSWVKWRVVKLVNGLATGSATVIVPATSFVILNALATYRSRGAFYPVAGDQGGVLPDSCVILQNPSTKSQRDKLISYRINPIFDTGVRGIQIYGNETLNPQFTDLSAAHIARTLVQIRSQVDAYSETIKFKLNDIFTWSTWISYVSTKILEPIKSLGGLQWFQVNMGRDTTTRDEISQRKIRGMISLQFTPDLEIIDLEFVIMASSLELATE